MSQTDVFRVDSYEIAVEVWPVAECVFRVSHGIKEATVKCNNVAKIGWRVTVAQDNSCQDIFTLRYGTRGPGFVAEPQLIPPVNAAPPAALGRHHDWGKEVTFCFRPEAGATYSMAFELFKGFDPGNRNVHFHLHPRTHYKTVLITLDLRGYVNGGFPLTHGPDLHFHQDDPQDHDLCPLRGFGNQRKPCRMERGLWQWQMDNVDRGVIDVVWDLEGPEKQIRKADPEAEARLKLIADNLVACQVFEVVMKVVMKHGPTSFRQVCSKAAGLAPNGF